MNRGRFITLEGPEGAGKSTHLHILAGYLRNKGVEVVETREPGGTPLAETIRSLVRDVRDDAPVPSSETLLFLASRAQTVEKVIRPALERGAWVLCDRFADSTFAYQGFGRGFDVDMLKNINSFATGGLKPDLTFLLDIPPEISSTRLANRQKATSTAADRIESAGDGFHRRLRDGFLELAKCEPERFAVIDASGDMDAVSKSMENVLEKRFYLQ